MTEADEDAFTLAHSHRLSQALHERTGWPLVVVSDGPDGPVGWVHTGVRVPDGRILDVSGLHVEEHWVDEWGQWVDAYGGDLPGDEYDGDKVWVYPAEGHLGWVEGQGWGLAEGESLGSEVESRAGEVADLLISAHGPSAEEAPQTPDAGPLLISAHSPSAEEAPQTPDAGPLLDMLDQMNANGDISYDAYSQLHDMASTLAAAPKAAE